MHEKRILPTRSHWVVLALVLAMFAATAPAFATGCNGGGCWSAKVNFLRIGIDGKIWFVVENSAALNALVPQDGCVLRNHWTGQAEPALYIRTDDPQADEKYTMLLTAFNTGTLVGFAPVKDPATNWCSLDYLYLKQ